MAYHRAGGDGFKGLTAENWLECDSAACRFVRLHDGTVTRITGKQWAESFVGPVLERAVPSEIRELFETARGAFCYGYFFHPLYVLGGEQLGQALEMALQHRCSALKAPKTHAFAERVAWLQARGVIKAEQAKEWEAARKLRTAVSHPEREAADAPPLAARYLKTTAALINGLYSVAVLNNAE